MRKVLFLDRGGTLLEPPIVGRPTDTADQVRLVRGVIPALLRIRAAGYELVVVTNQAGLGGPDYPRAAYDRIDGYMAALFASQGIEFAARFVCPHRPEERCACRAATENG